MRVLVLGGQGMLGHKLVQTLQPRWEVYATFRRPGVWMRFPMFQVTPERWLSGVEVHAFESVIRAIAQVRPQVVINCIGIIKQLAEAQDPILSLEVNALFPHRLAALCAAAGARLIHISTDCVFSGRQGNYQETDNPDPVDLYGRSKLLGEVTAPPHLTLRTSIIGRDFVNNTGLVEWFLSQRSGQVFGYQRAIYSGLTTLVLTRLIETLLAQHADLSGLYHVASAPIDKFNLLRQIRDAAQLPIELVQATSPVCDRSLKADRLRAATGYVAPSWETMIAEMVAEFPLYEAWRQQHGISGR